MSGRSGTWIVGTVLAVGVLFAVLQSDRTPPPLRRGRMAPPIALPDVESGECISLADFENRVVLVNFWATWCKPCEDEMPAMEQLYRTLKPSGFELLAISVDREIEDVREFRERLQLTFPILLDPDQRVARSYQTYRFPESFLIRPGGSIVERYLGPREWNAPAYVNRVRTLLAGSSTPTP